MNTGALDFGGLPAWEVVPSTFEERGTTIPFTTPELVCSRVRRGSTGQLEVLVPGFSGGRGIFVFPWHKVPEIVRLTLHDQALHAEISHSEAITPDRMQRAACRVARSGLGGPALAVAASNRLEDEKSEKLTLRYHIMLKAIEVTGVLHPEVDLGTLILHSQEGKVLVRTAFRKLARSLKTDPATVYTCMGELADLIQPVGFDADGQQGRLRRLFHRLKNFRYEAVSADIGPPGRTLASVSTLTLQVGTGIFSDLDRSVTDFTGSLIDWQDRVAEVRRSLDRLSWLLDGWEHVIELWDRAIDGNRGTLGRIDPALIAELARIVPVAPRSECDSRTAVEMETLHRRRNRIVQQFQDWRSGEFDHEMMDRVQAFRARAAEHPKELSVTP
jgi:hypothetical protein